MQSRLPGPDGKELVGFRYGRSPPAAPRPVRGRAMRWASRLVGGGSPAEAAEAAAPGLVAELGGPPDLVVSFVATEDLPAYRAVRRALRGAFPDALRLGCSAAGLIAARQEVEWEPGVALAAARLPGVDLRPLRVSRADAPGDDTGVDWFRELVGPDPAAVLLLTHPAGFDPTRLLEGVDAAAPGVVAIGGVASNLPGDAGPALWLDDDTHSGGMVGVAFSGALRVESLVAQGCRPFGQPLFVTAAEANRIRTLDGRPPVEAIQEALATLTADDLQLAKRALFVGIGAEPGRSEYGQGDFVVRNLLGIDASTGALWIGGHVDVGSVVQLHLRDGATSAQDLAEVLGQTRERLGDARPAGGLLFSCLGRGKRLYGHPGHDSERIRGTLGDFPLAGFFCNGEIGPVGRRTFLHGYTSAGALFLPEADPTR